MHLLYRVSFVLWRRFTGSHLIHWLQCMYLIVVLICRKRLSYFLRMKYFSSYGSVLLQPRGGTRLLQPQFLVEGVSFLPPFSSFSTVHPHHFEGWGRGVLLGSWVGCVCLDGRHQQLRVGGGGGGWGVCVCVCVKIIFDQDLKSPLRAQLQPLVEGSYMWIVMV